MQRHEHGVEENDGTGDGDRNGWAAPTTTARRNERASERTLDPGDTHDKGEASLCVGEAA
jgi:hypothetical protein